MVGRVVVVRTSNVGCFSTDITLLDARQLDINGCIITVPDMPGSRHCFQNDSGKWSILATGEKEAQRSTSPYTILRSSGPLKIVVSGGGTSTHEMSIARRLAHDLGVYYKLDADIVLDTEMVLPSPGSTTTLAEPESGNIVVIGNPSGRYIRQCLEKGKTAFGIVDKQDGPPLLQLGGETLNDSSQGIMFTHPHGSSQSSTMLFIIAHDRSGLERAARLFPTRTGLALADWMVIGKQADDVGASGIQKAGLWGCSWGYHSGMSWQH